MYNLVYSMPSVTKYYLKSNIFAMHNPSLIHKNMLYYMMNKYYSTFHTYVFVVSYIMQKPSTRVIIFSSHFFLEIFILHHIFVYNSLCLYYFYHILLLIYSCNPYSKYTLTISPYIEISNSDLLNRNFLIESVFLVYLKKHLHTVLILIS